MIYDLKAECLLENNEYIIEVSMGIDKDELFIKLCNFITYNMFIVTTKVGLDYTYIALTDIDLDSRGKPYENMNDYPLFIPLELINLTDEINAVLSNSADLNFRFILSMSGHDEVLEFTLDKNEGGLIKNVR